MTTKKKFKGYPLGSLKVYGQDCNAFLYESTGSYADTSLWNITCYAKSTKGRPRLVTIYSFDQLIPTATKFKEEFKKTKLSNEQIYRLYNLYDKIKTNKESNDNKYYGIKLCFILNNVY